MARTVRNNKVDTRSARAKLTQKKSCYWTGISPGYSLGYRKGRTGGVWIAKFVLRGKRVETTLGRTDDVLEPDGTLILSYVQAQERARVWFLSMTRSLTGHAVPNSEYTVAQCIEDYLLDLTRRAAKSIDDAKSRARAHIIPLLGRLRVSELSSNVIRNWHHGLAQGPKRIRSKRGEPPRYQLTGVDPESVRKRRATANRTLTVLKGALNFAFKEDRVESDEPWRRVLPYRNVETARLRYLTARECTQLLDAASQEFRPLIRAALVTGCRYSELVALCAADFDEKAGVIRVRTSKSGHPRYVVLRPDGISLFQELTRNLGPAELILQKHSGKGWGKSHQIRPLALASQSARLAEGVTFHILRHTYASHLAMAGVPLIVIAENLGHADSRMTEKHYAHLAKSYVADELRKATLSLKI